MGNKILVIDDSRVIRRTVKDMLPDGDFDVVEAKDGQEGMNLINQERPNLIMLDFILPKLSGWEVFQQIQSSPELQQIPLVLMSGKKEEVISKIPEPFEYFEFIEKPFDKSDLSNAIRQAMSKAKKARPQQGKTDIPDSPVEVITETTVNSVEVQELRNNLQQLKKVSSDEFQEIYSQLSELQQNQTTETEQFNAKISGLQEASSAEIQRLRKQVNELETEIHTLKKQLGQLVILIKKKLT
jgi:DNA-binding response OmpR family regulator